MPSETLIWQGVGLLALLACSAFFSMAETALVATDRIEVRNRVNAGDKRAARLEKLLNEPEKIITTILLGNNLVNIAAAALATLVAVDAYGEKTGAAVATILTTVVVLVFAEITPKTLAVRRAMAIGLVVSAPLRIIQIVLTPFVKVLSAFAKILLRPFGIPFEDRIPVVSQAQISQMVKVGVEEGEVEKFEERVIHELFDFTETPVVKVMTPASRVRYLKKDASLIEALELAGRSGHSRLPVADGTFDHVLGFVHAKDLLRFSDKELHDTQVTHVLRAVLFARDETRADQVLARMQRERKLMAIVQDGEGHNLGIATVEDLLEELVGEIHDEFDRH